MKGLLHSKRFRKNLKKWLCMYVGTLLILTTVITYSKYITSLGGEDKARVTKFDVKIDNNMPSCDEVPEGTPCCTGSVDDENLSCTTVDYRPTEEITYEYKVDYEFEVNTILSISTYIDNRFELVSITANDINQTYTTSTDNNYNVYSISDEYLAGTDSSKTFKVTVKYAEEGFTTAENKFSGEVIHVNYSASQIKDLVTN